MNKKYNIVIDLLGSDKGPEEILEGAKLALEKFDNIGLTLVGDEQLIKKSGIDLSRVKIIHTTDTITNFDNPVKAFYERPDVSVFKAAKELSDGDYIGMINAGNSGALLVSCIRFLLDEKRHRPCLSANLPNIKGGFTLLVDTGASIDAGPNQLHEFAILGTEFMRNVYGIESPRVGLLSNGSEPTKGNHLVKETYPILEADKSLNFVGNIEGNKTLNGDCDVLICEGFAGNQVLKNSEGMAINLIKEIMKFGKMNPDFGNASMAIVQHLMKTYDFESLGVGIVLGIKNKVLKVRGSSGKEAILMAVKVLLNMAQNKTVYEGEREA